MVESGFGETEWANRVNLDKDIRNFLEKWDSELRFIIARQMGENVDSDEVSDIWSDVVTAIFEGVTVGNIDLGNLKSGFVRTVARNKSVDWIRKQQGRRSRSSPITDAEKEIMDHSANPEDVFCIQESYRRLIKTIENLPELQREIVQLRLIEGYSYQEISAVLHLPVNTIRAYYSRARQKLLKVLLDGEDL